MYIVVVTPGLVLHKRPLGEGSASVFLLTPALGLVRARAQGARLQKSKLRYGLEPLTTGRYSLVRGKQEWRLTGVEEPSRECMRATLPQRKRLGQVSRLLLRLVLGAQPSPELYQTVRHGFEQLARIEQDADAVECVLVLRILGHLGYLPELPLLQPFIESDTFTPELRAQALASHKLLVRLINDSLQATGL